MDSFAGTKISAPKIDLQYLVKGLSRHLMGGHLRLNASIVNQDIEPAPGILHLLHQGENTIFLRYICLNDCRFDVVTLSLGNLEGFRFSRFGPL